MIDAHHHIWRQADLPWLQGPEQPRIFGPYGSIKRDYLIDEYLDDVAKSGITKSVYVQANWPADKFEDEAAWVQSVSDQSGWPHAIVGYADFTVEDVRPQLDLLAKYPLMRGVRQQFHWHDNPLYCFASNPDMCLDPVVQKNVGHLADYGWSFDLQVFPSQMAGGATLATTCPKVTFILQHAGMLEDTSEDGLDHWEDGMKQLASCRNVVSKLSAFGTFIHRNDPAFIKQRVEATVDLFGAERCMFGSNFPIEKIWTNYTALIDAFKQAVEALGADVQEAIFKTTAERVYKI